MTVPANRKELCDAYDAVKADPTLSDIDKITVEAYLLGAMGGLIGEDITKVKKSVEKMISKSVPF